MTNDLQSIKMRANLATPGPWKVDLEDATIYAQPADHPTPLFVPHPEHVDGYGAPGVGGADAKFAAHARADVPYLLDLIGLIQQIAESAVNVHGRLSVRDEILKALDAA